MNVPLAQAKSFGSNWAKLDHKTREIKCLIGKTSPLSLENKILIYKTIIIQIQI